MDEEEEQQKLPDLVKELVHRLLRQNLPPDSPPLNPNSPQFQNSLRYALRILSSRLTPSVAPDAAAIAESIKRRLATQGRSSEALSFADLYTKFASKATSVNNKWAVLYLLKIISEDRKTSKAQVQFDSASVLLPNLTLSDTAPRRDNEKGWNDGVLLLAKDPENRRDIAFREFVNLVREESEVSEEILVKDVLYACQGVDGTYVKFESEKNMLLGTYHRDELGEYYKLLAVLGAQSSNPIPLVSESASSGNYLSLRRLAVWLAEPMVKMRLMGDLVDRCRVLRGGAMAGAIHLHAQHGDPLVHEFMRRLLQRVCSPLFEMVRRWVLEGELEDIFAEFFIVGQPVKAESLWREGYRLHDTMLPSFISPSLAQRILRTGKSINFLRVCCEDRGWAHAANEVATDTGATARRGGFGYGETDTLESLVDEAAKRIDKHLLDVIYKRYKFKEHCLAIKRYLCLAKVIFVQYLMDIVGPELSEPANTISSFKLSGLLETAIRASNAQYDDPDILDRLRVKMMPHESGDRGWDVFSLEYDARVPLDTVFTESVMASKDAVGFNIETLPAHEKYLHSIVEKSLLGELSQSLYKSLLVIFNLYYVSGAMLIGCMKVFMSCKQESSLSSRDQNKSRKQLNDKSAEQGSWIADGRKALTQRAGEFLRNMGQDLDAIAKEYSSLQEGFISQLPVQQHVDLKFLFFRLDFNEFYRRLCPSI
ncbi:Gamma-tubulin complex component protein [Sesbania bispinosa]|nr:Gamma-tubulin complex component protein [Sesbania bispinosa]